MSKNIFIIGGSGSLGSNLIASLLQTEKCKVFYTYNSTKLDITHSNLHPIKVDFKKIEQLIKLIRLIEETKGEIIIFFLAAISHPDKVQSDLESAKFINVQFPRILSKTLFKRDNVKTFYSSTDMVYGESKNDYYYTECDAIKGYINEYSRQKIEAEKIMFDVGATIFRHTFMFGLGVYGKRTFYNSIVETLKKNEALDLFYDSYRNFIDFKTATEMMVEISNRPSQHGIINLCCDKKLSKYEIGVLIAEKFNLDKELLNKVSFEQETSIYKVKRPKTTLMSNNKLKEILSLDKIEIKL